MKSNKAKQDEAAAVEAAPENFAVSSLDQNAAVREAIELLESRNMDPAAFGKKRREARRAAWGAFKLGGGGRSLQADITRLTASGAETAARLEGATDQELRRNLQAHVEGLSKEIAGKAALLEAVGGPGRDLNAELARDRRALAEAEDTVSRYRGARLPVPAAVQDRVLGLREKMLATEAVEENRRSEFDAVSAEAAKLTREALGGLGTTLIDLAGRCARHVEGLLRADLRRLEAFPDSADPEIASEYGTLERACGLADRLGREGRLARAQFWAGLSDRERDALGAVLRLGRAAVESGMRPRKPHPDPLMNMVT